MVDIFDELTEDLKRERFDRLVKQFAPWVFALAICVIIVTGFVVWKQNRETKQLTKLTTLLTQDNFDIASAHKLTHYKLYNLVQLKYAKILVNQNKIDDAIKLYEEISANYRANKEICDVASLLSFMLKMEHHKPITDYDLSTLDDKENMFYKSNMIIKSTWLISVNKFAEAEESLAQLSSSNVQDKVRALRMLMESNKNKGSK
jgi:predicted negative regulator of RcsB-dependent stress response